MIGGYVCSRPDAASLVGDGISAVWGRFLVSSDPNAPLNPSVPESRFDWVLERVDGTAARIHPSSSAHGAPVYYVRYTGGEGLIDLQSRRPFVAVADLDEDVIFA